MASHCSECGYSYKREPGFYLGTIYLNYGATVICTGLLYGFIVLGLGGSHQMALGVSLVAAIVLPVPTGSPISSRRRASIGTGITECLHPTTSSGGP